MVCLLFLKNLGAQKDKKGLSNDQNTKKSSNPITFVPECTMIELYDDIDEDLWIDDTIPLDFDYFSTYDDLLEYMGYIHNYPK